MAVGLFAIVLVVVSACSSSGSKSSEGSASSKSGGNPIKIVAISDSSSPQSDGQYAGSQAAVDAINAAGGINGRQIAISRCNTNRDPNQAAKCASDTVSDSSVVAVVGSENTLGTNVVPVLEKAHMPDIGGESFTAADFKSPVSFPDDPGSTIVASAGMMFVSQGLTKLGVAYLDSAAGAQEPGLVSAAIGSRGSVVAKVAVPLNAADISSQVTALKSSGAQAIVMGLPNAPQAQFINTAAQLGVTQPLGLNGITITSDEIAKLPSSLHFYLASYFDHSSKGYAQAVADLKKYQPQQTFLSDAVITGWLGVETFAKIAGSASDISRAGLLAAARKTSALDTFGLTPTVDFTRDNPVLGDTFSRQVNTNFYAYQLKGTTLTSTNGNKALPIFGS